MQITCQLKKRTLIVALDGELDHHTAGQIRGMIEQAITEQKAKHLVFDFSSLHFMDSSGIGMIIGRYKLIKSLGGNVFLVCGGGRIEKLIALSGLTRLIPVYKTVDEALTNIKEG